MIHADVIYLTIKLNISTAHVFIVIVLTRSFLHLSNFYLILFLFAVVGQPSAVA